jgi:hypothetical protein
MAQVTKVIHKQIENIRRKIKYHNLDVARNHIHLRN